MRGNEDDERTEQPIAYEEVMRQIREGRPLDRRSLAARWRWPEAEVAALIRMAYDAHQDEVSS